MKLGKYCQRVSLVVTAFAMLVGVLLPGSASAQSSAALSIAPKKQYTINPGGEVEDTLKVRNLDDSQSLQLSLSVIDFTYTEDTGIAKLFTDPNAPQTTWSLRPYTSVPGKITIPAGSSQDIPITISMKDVKAGSYYSAIQYSAGSGDSTGGANTNVGLSASGVTLVFVTVPGKVDEKLTVKKFGAYQEKDDEKQSGYKYFNFDEPLRIGYTLENKGNVTESPVGSIELKDLFGHTYSIQDINPSGSLALIDQTRTFRVCIKQKKEDVDFEGAKSEASQCTTPHLWPGYYRATLSGFYGYNGNTTQEFNARGSFWYLPMWFIFAFLVTLLIVGYFIWSVVERIRGRAQYRPKKK